MPCGRCARATGGIAPFTMRLAEVSVRAEAIIPRQEKSSPAASSPSRVAPHPVENLLGIELHRLVRSTPFRRVGSSDPAPPPTSLYMRRGFGPASRKRRRHTRTSFSDRRDHRSRQATNQAAISMTQPASCMCQLAFLYQNIIDIYIYL